MQDRNRKIVAAIIISFLLLQFIILLVFGYTPYPDSNGYLLLAKESVKAGEPYPVSSQLDNLSFIWNIGAINLVALSLRLFNSIIPLLCLYSLLKGLSAWLVYEIARILFKKTERVAWIALLLYVLYPANYGESTSLLSELPFLFLILLGIYSMLKQHGLAGGAFMALANWIRPMGIVFLASAVFFLILRKKRNDVLKTIGGYLIIVVVFSAFTYHRTGYCIYQAKTGWMALLQYSVDHSSEDDAAYTRTEGFNAVQKDSVWRERTIEWIEKHPSEYIKQMPAKLVKTYVSDNVNFCTFLPDKNKTKYMYGEISMPVLFHQFPHYSAVQCLTVYNLIYYYLLLVLFLAGCIIAVRHKKIADIVLPSSIIVIGTVLLLLVGHGEARFHIPFMPFVIMVAAQFINKNILKYKI